MRILIVYETIYGTNRLIANAIAEGINKDASVTILEAKSAPTSISADVDLLVVGGPNHKAGLPSPVTRAEAISESSGIINSVEPGLREWLEDLRLDYRGQPVAVWDTRMANPRILDFIDQSARSITKRLSLAGARLISKPQKFYSADGIGALLEGEEKKACLWGTDLYSRISQNT
jgi:hypothetical protein